MIIFDFIFFHDFNYICRFITKGQKKHICVGISSAFEAFLLTIVVKFCSLEIPEKETMFYWSVYFLLLFYINYHYFTKKRMLKIQRRFVTGNYIVLHAGVIFIRLLIFQLFYSFRSAV